jgi:hypothetical protein
MGKRKLKFDSDLDINIPLMIALITTSIGAFGGFPKTPVVMENWLEKNPWARWALVWVLIYQGQGGEHEIETTLGTGITYLIWKYLNSLDDKLPTEPGLYYRLLSVPTNDGFEDRVIGEWTIDTYGMNNYTEFGSDTITQRTASLSNWFGASVEVIYV